MQQRNVDTFLLVIEEVRAETLTMPNALNYLFFSNIFSVVIIQLSCWRCDNDQPIHKSNYR